MCIILMIQVDLLFSTLISLKFITQIDIRKITFHYSPIFYHHRQAINKLMHNQSSKIDTKSIGITLIFLSILVTQTSCFNAAQDIYTQMHNTNNLQKISANYNLPAKTHFTYITNKTLLNNNGFLKAFVGIGYDIKYIGSQIYTTNNSQSYNISFQDDYRDPYLYPSFTINNETNAIYINKTIIQFTPGEVSMLLKLNWKKTTEQTTYNGSIFIRAKTQNISYNAIIDNSNSSQPNKIQLKIVNPQAIQVDFLKTQTNIIPVNTSTYDINYLNKFILEGTLRKQPMLSLIRNNINQKLPQKLIYYFNSSNKLPFDKTMKFSNYNVQLKFDTAPIYLKYGQNQLRYGYQMLNIYSDYYYNKIISLDCQQLNRTEPLPQYGASQQYSSYCFYQYVFRYAIMNNIVKNKIQREIWENKLFHFQALDLFDIIPKVATDFQPDQQINGSCLYDQSSVRITKSPSNMLLLKFDSNCYLNVSNTTVQQFKLSLQLEVKVIISLKYQIPCLYLNSFNFDVLYKSVDSYVVVDVEQANKIMRASLNILYQGQLFGSYWPVPLGMKNPGVIFLEKQILFYDKSML